MIGVFVAIMLSIIVIWTPGRFAGLPKWVHRVEFCPNLDNISEWIEASNRLNCGHDLLSKDPQKQSDVYHCLPSSFFNETVEFCGRNSPVQPGRCAVYNYEVFPNRAPTSFSCSKFSSGCPRELYFSKNTSFYPECFRINKRNKCYIADPSCKTSSQNFITKANESNDTNIAIFVPLLILLILGYIVIVVVYFYRKKRRHHKQRKHGQTEEMNGLLANGRPSAVNNGIGNDTNFTLDEQAQMAYQCGEYSRINALLDMTNDEFSSIKGVLKEDLVLNQPCAHNQQCSVSPHAACIEGRCSCKDGYKAQTDGQCEKEKASNGGLSSQNDQCINSTVCKNERCTCKQGFVFIDTDCHKKDVLLNQSCIYSHQCRESPYAACLEGRCSCIDGYKSGNDSQCEKEKASYGGICSQSDQCTEPTECRNGRCTCKQGFVFIDTDCLKIVPLNQSCLHNMQCSGSLYAACLNGKCDCINGYKAENSSDCVLHAQGSTSVNISILGILYGGFFLSGFSSAGLVFIIYRRFKSSVIRRPLSCSSFKEVYSLSRAAEFISSGPSSPKNTMREVTNIAPQKPPEYCNVSYKPERKLRNKDVYNHLNRVEEHEDSDNYDHACAATFHIGHSNIYNNVQCEKHIPILPEEINVDTNGYSTIIL